MKRKQMTDKQMLYAIIGKVTVKLGQALVLGAMFAGFVLVALNNMTVYHY